MKDNVYEIIDKERSEFLSSKWKGRCKPGMGKKSTEYDGMERDLFFTKVYKYLNQSFYNLIRKMDPMCSPSDKEDLAQEGLIYCLKVDCKYDASREDGKGRLSFLTMCGNRYLAKRVRKLKIERGRTLLRIYENDSIENIGAPEKLDVATVIRISSTVLTPIELQMFYMRHLEGYTYEEIRSTFRCGKVYVNKVLKESKIKVREALYFMGMEASPFFRTCDNLGEDNPQYGTQGERGELFFDELNFDKS